MPVKPTHSEYKIFPPSCVLPVGLLLGAVFWLIDAVIDSFLFGQNESFISNLLSPEPIEHWMRTLVLILLIIFSLFIRRTLSREQELVNQLKKHQDELEEIVLQRTQQLETLAMTDDLTGALNRRKFYEILDHEIDRYKRYGTELSLLLIDIDYFKKVNDNFGHHAGDHILKNFSDLIQNLIRKSDYFARIGGEEFAIILPQSNLKQAVNMAEKIRNRIYEYNFPEVGKLTASIGISEIQKNEEISNFTRRTDHALYA
ncbi:MAG: GGDEF domain-containing protein, partial [Gammaproteobacteria bacterium]|nr:GGDEF domain-containing protein [Gammaproteobacteria bacterium]